jgi:hypothetical protein
MSPLHFVWGNVAVETVLVQHQGALSARQRREPSWWVNAVSGIFDTPLCLNVRVVCLGRRSTRWKGVIVIDLLIACMRYVNIAVLPAYCSLPSSSQQVPISLRSAPLGPHEANGFQRLREIREVFVSHMSCRKHSRALLQCK